MEDAVQRRLAANETVLREVNEGIERGQCLGEGSSVGFRCECAQLGCNVLLALALSDYERVRAHSRRFVVIPGHENLEIETVVEDRADYIVVEKRGEAGRIAEAEDPRP